MGDTDDEFPDAVNYFDLQDLGPEAPTVWNETWELFAFAKQLHERLVPAHGEASTTHGETLRIVHNMYHDYHNNGNCTLEAINENGRLSTSERNHLETHGPPSVQYLVTLPPRQPLYESEMEEAMQDTIRLAAEKERELYKREYVPV